MATNPESSIVGRSVDEQFLDLLIADEELLRAEFDAINAEEWLSPPTDNPAGGASADRHPQRRGARRGEPRGTDLPTRPRHPGMGGWARPRSPPKQTVNPRK